MTSAQRRRLYTLPRTEAVQASARATLDSGRLHLARRPDCGDRQRESRQSDGVRRPRVAEQRDRAVVADAAAAATGAVQLLGVGAGRGRDGRPAAEGGEERGAFGYAHAGGPRLLDNLFHNLYR